MTSRSETRSRPMRRKFFTLAAGVSAVLCLALAVAWVESYRTARLAFWTAAGEPGSRERRTVFASSVRGVTYISVLRYTHDSAATASRLRAAQRGLRFGTRPAPAVISPPWTWLWVGFAYRVIRDADKSGQAAGVPYWFWTAACAGLPSLWVIRRRRTRRRRSQGLCPTCGYDLRATPDHCPEMFSLL